MKQILLTGMLCLCVFCRPGWARDCEYGPSPLDCVNLLGTILSAPCDIVTYCLGGGDGDCRVPSRCRPNGYPRRKRTRTSRVKEPALADQPRVPNALPTVERAAAPPEPEPRRIRPVTPGTIAPRPEPSRSAPPRALPSRSAPPRTVRPEAAPPRTVRPEAAPPRTVPSRSAPPRTARSEPARPPEAAVERTPLPRTPRTEARPAEPIAGPKVEEPVDEKPKAPPRTKRRAPRRCYPHPYYYYFR
jgi:hypothetical protein